VVPLGFRVNRSSAWADASVRAVGYRPDFLEPPFSVLGVVRPPSSGRLVQIGFPSAGFRGLRADLVLDEAAPVERFPEAVPERTSGRQPKVDLTVGAYLR